MNYHRTCIYLTKVQVKRLKDEAKKKGLSTAELIRRIIDNFFENIRKE